MGRPGRRTAYNTAAMNLGTVGIAPFVLVVAAPFASGGISATRTSCGAYAIVGNLVLLCEVQIDDCSGMFDPPGNRRQGKPCLTQWRRGREDRILVQKTGSGDIGTDHL